jgi:hypothetical protein
LAQIWFGVRLESVAKQRVFAIPIAALIQTAGYKFLNGGAPLFWVKDLSEVTFGNANWA